MKHKVAKLVLPGLALVIGGIVAVGCSSSGKSTSTAPEIPNLRGRVTLASPARAVAAPGTEIMLDGVATGEITDAQGDFAMTVDPGIHTFGVKDVPGTIGVDVLPDGVVELEVEVQPTGEIVAQEDINHDGKVNGGDDSNHDGDINDDNDNSSDDNGIGDDNGVDGPDDNGVDGPDDNGTGDSGKDRPDDGSDDGPDDNSGKN
jgi:hypothetical protein